MPYTRSDFDGPLLNFTIILKFGGPSRLGVRDKLPPPLLPFPLGGPATTTSEINRINHYKSVEQNVLRALSSQARSPRFISKYS